MFKMKRCLVTLEQKFYLKFMHLHLKYDAEQIRRHVSMLRPDGTSHRMSTIKFWIENLINLDSKTKKKTGRPTVLNEDQVDNLIELVREKPKSRYNQIRKLYLDKYGLNIHKRTINNYLLKNQYRK